MAFGVETESAIPLFFIVIVGIPRVAAQRSLAKSGFMLLLAGILFLVHWRWLRRRVEAGGIGEA